MLAVFCWLFALLRRKTDVAATTIHNMFEFDGEFKTRLDFSKLAGEKVSALMALEVLLLDEVTVRYAGSGGVNSWMQLDRPFFVLQQLTITICY